MATISKSKINNFQNILLIWFASNARTFSWRQEMLSSFEIVIAEILLQRTKAETVEKFYRSFLIIYPNWENIASAPIVEIEAALKPVGLYRQRAKRLQNLAIELVKAGGRLPNNRLDLEEIPMFGQYIANAIELQVFNRPKPLLDVNMARVLERYFGPRKLADIRYDSYLQKLAHEIVDHPDSKHLSWAILDFAAKVCRARTPLCTGCPLSADCTYYKLIAIK